MNDRPATKNGFCSRSARLYLMLFLVASHCPILKAQRIDGVFKGQINNKLAILELSDSHGLMVGTVYGNLTKKWFFTATHKGYGFDGYSTLGLNYEAFITGRCIGDSIYLTIEAKDSSYAGQFIRTKEKIKKLLESAESTLEKARDPSLIGEWITVDYSGPNKEMLLGIRITFNANGTAALNKEDINNLIKKLQSMTLNPSQEFRIPDVKIQTTWHTEQNLLIEKVETQFGEKEFEYKYVIKNDTLIKCNEIKHLCETLVRVIPKKK